MKGLLAFVPPFLINIVFVNCKTINQPSGHNLSDISNADGFLTVPELIAKNGYPVETHEVITADGYILTVYRIPFGIHCKKPRNQQVIFLQHGIMTTSADWVYAGPQQSLGYYLADNCYDVWLGNHRGTTYSKRHVTLDPEKDKSKFWDFTFNEMGLYDIPASIDYVLNVTGVNSLSFVGHSMGTTSFFVCMSERPEYNAKIKLMSAFAPIAYLKHLKTPVRLLTPFGQKIENFAHLVGNEEVTIPLRIRRAFGQAICHQNSTIRELCDNLVYILDGYNPDQMKPGMLPVLLGHYPDSTSIRTLAHFGQSAESGKFRKFDFGSDENLKIYGKQEPPDYILENITAPVAIYFGENDWWSAKPDVVRLANGLPNLKRFYRIKNNRYTHHDFLQAKDNVELLNKPFLEFLRKF